MFAFFIHFQIAVEIFIAFLGWEKSSRSHRTSVTVIVTPTTKPMDFYINEHPLQQQQHIYLPKKENNEHSIENGIRFGLVVCLRENWMQTMVRLTRFSFFKLFN